MSAVGHLCSTFLQNHPVEAVRILERHPADAVVRILATQTPDAVAAILQASLPIIGAAYLSHMPREQAMEAIQNLDSEHTLRLLRHQHPEQREALLNALPERISKGYRRLLHYAEHCVGAHMNPFIFVLATGTSVAEATQRVSQQDTHSQFFPFVVDHDQRLVGVLTVSDLIRASPKTRLEDIMRKDVVRLSAYATMDDVRKISGRSAFHSLPVLDVDGTLIGVIDQDGLKRLELGKYPVASEPPPFADGLALLGSAYFHVLSTFALQLTQPGPGTHGPHPESTQHAN